MKTISRVRKLHFQVIWLLLMGGASFWLNGCGSGNSGASGTSTSSTTAPANSITATPVFSPAAGTYTATQTVTISSATGGASIFYTTNGTVPTTASTPYTGPIAVSASETLQAIAIATGYSSSPAASAAYVINLPAATPVFSPAAGTYTATQTVTISSATGGASIFYTTNGTVPTTASTPYTGPIAVSASETLQAIAIATGYSSSPAASAAYVITSPTLTFSPASGNFPDTAVSFSATAINVNIYNATASPVIFTGFAIAGPNGSDFSQVNNCGVPLQPGQSCTAQVLATPSALGTRTASFMLASSASASPQSIPLSVKGVNASAGPASLSATKLLWGVAGTTQDIDLQNLGNTPLTIKSIASSDSSFVVSNNNCGTTLPAQSICTISVVSNGFGVDYSSYSAQTYSGTLTVTDDAVAGPQTAQLVSTNTQQVASYNPQQVSGGINFGSAPVGSSVTRNVSVTGATHNIQASFAGSMVGTNSGDFTPSQAGCMGSGYAPVWEGCQFPLTFTPSAGGTRTAKLQYSTSILYYGPTAGYIPLVGSAPGAPGTAFTAPQSLTVAATFDSVGQASGSASFTVLNSGSTTITIPSFPIYSVNPLPLSATGNCSSVVAGASCTVTVSYNSSVAMPLTAALLLQDTVSGRSQFVSINANTYYQGVTTSPATLTFGPQPVGVLSASQTFTVGDNNSQPLGHALTASVAVGSANFALTQGATCPASTTQLCTLGVDFSATTAGMFQGLISVVDTVSHIGAYVQVTGIAVGTPMVSLSTNSIVFPSRPANSTSLPTVVTLTNTGTSRLTVSAVNLTGVVQGNFSQTNTCSAVAPSSTCTISVTFAPKTTGQQTASIQILSDAASSPNIIQLSGTAQ